MYPGTDLAFALDWEEQKGQGGTAAESTVKVACKGCNSGWMSRLEQDARPILLRHVTDRRAVLTEQDRVTLVR